MALGIGGWDEVLGQFAPIVRKGAVETLECEKVGLPAECDIDDIRTASEDLIVRCVEFCRTKPDECLTTGGKIGCGIYRHPTLVSRTREVATRQREAALERRDLAFARGVRDELLSKGKRISIKAQMGSRVFECFRYDLGILEYSGGCDQANLQRYVWRYDVYELAQRNLRYLMNTVPTGTSERVHWVKRMREWIHLAEFATATQPKWLYPDNFRVRIWGTLPNATRAYPTRGWDGTSLTGGPYGLLGEVGGKWFYPKRMPKGGRGWALWYGSGPPFDKICTKAGLRKGRCGIPGIDPGEEPCCKGWTSVDSYLAWVMGTRGQGPIPYRGPGSTRDTIQTVTGDDIIRALKRWGDYFISRSMDELLVKEAMPRYFDAVNAWGTAVSRRHGIPFEQVVGMSSAELARYSTELRKMPLESASMIVGGAATIAGAINPVAGVVLLIASVLLKAVAELFIADCVSGNDIPPVFANRTMSEVGCRVDPTAEGGVREAQERLVIQGERVGLDFDNPWRIPEADTMKDSGGFTEDDTFPWGKLMVAGGAAIGLAVLVRSLRT